MLRLIKVEERLIKVNENNNGVCHPLYLYPYNNNMPTLNKNSTPWILVIISMFLLFLFVGYWNYSTYSREKKQLSDDVAIQLQLSYTEIKDSELILFIKTQLTDSIGGQKFPDSLSLILEDHPMFPSFRNSKASARLDKLKPGQKEPDTTIIIDFDLNNNTTDPFKRKFTNSEITVIASSHDDLLSNEKIQISRDSSKSEYNIKQINIRGNSNSTQDLVLRKDSSVSSEWVTSNDSIHFQFGSIITSDSDTNDFNSFQFSDRLKASNHISIDKTFALFKEKLIANKLPSEFNIVKNAESRENGMRVRYSANGFRHTEWIVDLQNYRSFILKKMFPTLLFSIFLLGMISLAFWTLLNNWIKQNRLAKIKNEFINNMTHELKTPIATVGVALEAVSNFDLQTEKDKAKEYLTISRNEINKLSLLVDKVLNIAAFDSKEVSLNTELVNLDDSIKNTLDSLKLQFETNGIKLNYTNEVKNPLILGDKLHITNVIHNLLDNAIKYSGEHPIIDIHLSEKNNFINISIKDNGQGIPYEYQSKIFDRFFRVPNEDKHDVKGHGLGLNYVKNVIERFGGKIKVQSVENQGSEFIISLPKNVSDV